MSVLVSVDCQEWDIELVRPPMTANISKMKPVLLLGLVILCEGFALVINILDIVSFTVNHSVIIFTYVIMLARLGCFSDYENEACERVPTYAWF